MNLAKRIEDRVKGKIKNETEEKRRDIFNKQVTDGLQLNYADLRQLDSTLKADYLKHITEQSRKVDNKLTEALIRANKAHNGSFEQNFYHRLTKLNALSFDASIREQAKKDLEEFN